MRATVRSSTGLDTVTNWPMGIFGGAASSAAHTVTAVRIENSVQPTSRAQSKRFRSGKYPLTWCAALLDIIKDMADSPQNWRSELPHFQGLYGGRKKLVKFRSNTPITDKRRPWGSTPCASLSGKRKRAGADQRRFNGSTSTASSTPFCGEKFADAAVQTAAISAMRSDISCRW